MTLTTLAPPIFKNAIVRTVLSTFLLTGVVIALGYALAGARSDYQTPEWAIWIHLATVLPGLPLGAWVLWKPKGTRAHKIGGRIWGVLMIITAIDSFWIRSLTGTFSPIHIFSVLTLVSMPLGVWHIRNGRVEAHFRAMRGVYIGLCVAGLFAMMPGRVMGTLIFG